VIVRDEHPRDSATVRAVNVSAFATAAEADLSEFEAPEEAFMLIELRPGYLRGARGIVRYHAAFKEV
jgi:predicted N-acetyltransferase YhbS